MLNQHSKQDGCCTLLDDERIIVMLLHKLPTASELQYSTWSQVTKVLVESPTTDVTGHVVCVALKIVIWQPVGFHVH